jgi:DegV family protein with EDD domain
MSSIAIITDTDSSLPADIAARHEIWQVPITIHFGEEMFRTGEDIDDAQLFARVNREGRLPTTSAPSPGDFAQTYQAAFESGADEVICFCVSSEVSATYQAALAARDLVTRERMARDLTEPGAAPGRQVTRDALTVIDSRSLSVGQGFMVLAAAEAAQAGASRDEILARAEDVRDRTHLYAALSTLKYLAMSGRVGHLAAGMANLLNVKPILTIRDGKLDLLERVRTQRKAWGRVIELAEGALGGRDAERMAILHVDAAEAARRFQEQLCARLTCSGETFVAELTPGLSVHAGAGLVGVVVVAPHS